LDEGGGAGSGAKGYAGSKHQPIEISGANSDAVVDGLAFKGHALDRMQGRGIPQSAVRQALDNPSVPGRYPGTYVHYDEINNISVVIDDAGVVRTVRYGRP
jgi:hypothetical protein